MIIQDADIRRTIFRGSVPARIHVAHFEEAVRRQLTLTPDDN
jgi:hypothetical protein